MVKNWLLVCRRKSFFLEFHSFSRKLADLKRLYLEVTKFRSIIILTSFAGGTVKYQARCLIRARACEGAYLTEGLVFHRAAQETGQCYVYWPTWVIQEFVCIAKNLNEIRLISWMWRQYTHCTLSNDVKSVGHLQGLHENNRKLTSDT